MVCEVVFLSLTGHTELMNKWTDEEYEAFLDNEESRANAYLCEQDDKDGDTE